MQPRRHVAVAAFAIGVLGIATASMAAKPPQEPVRSLDPESFTGRWAGETASWREASRRWVVERRADGRFEADLKFFVGKNETTRTAQSGTWRFHEGLLEMKVDGDGDGSPVQTFRVRGEGASCLRLQRVGMPQDEAPQGLPSEDYGMIECPYPSRLPAVDSFRCRAEIRMPVEPKLHRVDVAIERTPDGRLKAQLDGKTSNEDVDVWDHPVRAGFKPAGTALDAATPGELSLMHLYQLASQRELRDLGVKFEQPFRYSEVRMVRIYELEPGSRFNKFGGSTLFEAFDGRGRTLGKMLRALVVIPCKPVAAPRPR